MKAKYIYILKLESKKWYIGISENIENRINNHIKGKGSRWTNIYKPLKLIKSYKIKDLHDEDKVTIEYMEKYGINNVRGGSFCNIELSEAEKEVLRKMIKTQNNKCFKCGQDGHYSNKCTEEWIDVSDSESESEYESEERYNKCFRCNRKGHMRNNCYAKTDVYGNKLYDESEDEDISIDEEYEEYEEYEDDCYKCFRCNRKGHMRNNCYAKTDVYGNYIKN